MIETSREAWRYVRVFLAVFCWAPGYAEANVVRVARALAHEFPHESEPIADWLGCPPTPEAVDPARVPPWVRPTVLRVCRALCLRAPHRERYATLYLLEELWTRRSPVPAAASLAVA